ncbi:DCC1-like thiol-disulfide oxidoreductase family protein [Candidatus Kapabacteria bacterium]|nr:DCC1-like thiol-disulfide oxidoreductase family protein [Candidatus Kapabacteria bacterium]
MENHKYILLFDGYCGLCNSSVNFILDKDRIGTMKFASLQSQTGLEIIEGFPKIKDLDSLILYSKLEEKVYVKSEAVLKICKYLGGSYKLFLVFRLFPFYFLNIFYDLIAKYRYKFFGKYDVCTLPNGDSKSRIIE